MSPIGSDSGKPAAPTISPPPPPPPSLKLVSDAEKLAEAITNAEKAGIAPDISEEDLKSAKKRIDQLKKSDNVLCEIEKELKEAEKTLDLKHKVKETKLSLLESAAKDKKLLQNKAVNTATQRASIIQTITNLETQLNGLNESDETTLSHKKSLLVEKEKNEKSSDLLIDQFSLESADLFNAREKLDKAQKEYEEANEEYADADQKLNSLKQKHKEAVQTNLEAKDCIQTNDSILFDLITAREEIQTKKAKKIQKEEQIKKQKETRIEQEQKIRNATVKAMELLDQLYNQNLTPDEKNSIRILLAECKKTMNQKTILDTPSDTNSSGNDIQQMMMQSIADAAAQHTLNKRRSGISGKRVNIKDPDYETDNDKDDFNNKAGFDTLDNKTYYSDSDSDSDNENEDDAWDDDNLETDNKQFSKQEISQDKVNKTVNGSMEEKLPIAPKPPLVSSKPIVPPKPKTVAPKKILCKTTLFANSIPTDNSKLTTDNHNLDNGYKMAIK